tara:strand:- start:327 stop:713 length:387 start_codon:yes stop_codon:yes gene_type:complete
MTNFNPRGIFEHCEVLVQQTTMGVTEAMNHYAKKGYIPFIPTPDAQCDVDFLVYHPVNHNIIKVQCKTTTYIRNGKHIVALKSGEKGKGNRKVAKDFDELFALNSAGQTQVIPYDDIAGRSTQVTMGV